MFGFSWLLKEHQNFERYHSFENEAVVDEVIQQKRVWRVRFDGTFWTARCDQEVQLNPGDVVYVIGRQNITLLIEPARASASSSHWKN